MSPIKKVWLSCKDWSRFDKVRSPLEHSCTILNSLNMWSFSISQQLMLHRKWPQFWKKWGLRAQLSSKSGRTLTLSFDFEQIFWKCITIVLHTYIRAYIGSSARVVTLQEPISLYIFIAPSLIFLVQGP